MSLTIADRRAIAAQSLLNEGFRDRLLKDPRAAVTQVTGKTLPGDIRIHMMDEASPEWCFVMLDTDQIDADLPAPDTPRAAVENEIYTLLRKTPSLAVDAERDPVGFLRDHLKINVSGVRLRREAADEAVLILPDGAMYEELSDDVLDLVAGGGGDQGKDNNAGTKPVLGDNG